MGQDTYTGLTEEEVELFCEQMMAAAATKCEKSKQPDGSYNVVVEFPDE
jgi:CRISPR/Cas system type I-B associated protein Csh2 (Cas7 group RAMP superfamily)